MLGAFEVGSDRWPPFASNITLELFEDETPTTSRTQSKPKAHYVRFKYNANALALPYCAAVSSRHHHQDETLCTLDAFLELMNDAIPKDYQRECLNDHQ